jgi:hypothetical protein
VLIFVLGPVLFASVAYPLPTQYQASVAKWSGQYCSNIPNSPNLLSALIFTESGWHPTSRSGAGAVGLTQFIPSTAYSIAKQLGVSPFTPSDLINNPDLAIRFGAYYICQRIGDYGGNVTKGLIAYNGGGGAVVAYEIGTPIYSTVAYARKIISIQSAYQTIYGTWWTTTLPPSSTTGNATTAPPVQQFNVQPQTSLSLVTAQPLTSFWQGILFSNTASADGQSTSSNLSNFWKVFLPGGS